MSGSSVRMRKLDHTKELPTRSVIYHLDMRNCGCKTCKSCPHGPYWYERTWEGGKRKSKYIGKRRPEMVTAEEEAALLANLRLPAKTRKERVKNGGKKKSKE